MKRRQVKRSYQFGSLNDEKQPTVSNKVKKTIPIRNWWRGVWRYGPYIIGLVVLGYLVLFSNLFQINNIVVQGPNTALSQDLNREVEQFLKSRVLGRNWLLLNTKELQGVLQKSFSGQESITVDKIFPSKLVVKTDEQKSALIWKTGTRRYLLSVNGRVMSELQPDQTIDLIIITDSSNVPLQVGSQAVSRQFVTFTTAIVKAITDQSLGPAETLVRETTGELVVKTNQGYEIRFDTTADPDSQIRSLASILDLLKSQNKKPAEYIDLRIPNRAFYR